MGCPMVYLAPVLVFLLWRALRRALRRRPTKDDAILVTGCDSGIGLGVVKALLEQTDAQVFAGCITEEGRKRLAALGAAVTPLLMDVTKDADVANAFEELRKSGKSLRGVVNNAALGCYGFCEALSMERFEQNVNINFLGSIRVTKCALPLLRKSRGRLVTMGSIGGRFPSAFGSAYVPTKAAILSFQDCVRQEMYRFGVRCSIVEPGFFQTGLLHRAAALGEASSSGGAAEGELAEAYGTYAEKMRRTEGAVKFVERLNGGDEGVRKITDAVLDALTTLFPQTHYLVGIDANVIGRLAPLMPCWVVDLLQTYVI